MTLLTQHLVIECLTHAIGPMGGRKMIGEVDDGRGWAFSVEHGRQFTVAARRYTEAADGLTDALREPDDQGDLIAVAAYLERLNELVEAKAYIRKNIFKAN